MNKIDKYIHIALTMNSFEVGKPFSVNELAKRAKVHYSTAKKAVKFFITLGELGIPHIKGSLETAPYERLILIKKKKEVTEAWKIRDQVQETSLSVSFPIEFNCFFLLVW